MKKARVEVSKVMSDESVEEAAIYPVLATPGEVIAGRRGFLGTGLTAAAALSAVACSHSSEPIEWMEDEEENDGKARVPNREEMATNRLPAHTEPVVGIAFEYDSKVWTAARDGKLKAWNLSGALAEKDLGAPITALSELRASTIAVGTERGRIEVFATTPLSSRRKLYYGRTGPSSLALSPDGDVLAAAGESGSAIWHVDDGRRHALATRAPVAPGEMLFSPDGKFIIVLGESRSSLEFYLAASGEWYATMEHPDWPQERIRAMTFSRDRERLAVVGRRYVYVCDLGNRKVVARAARHVEDPEYVLFAKLSSDGKHLLVAGTKVADVIRMPWGTKLATGCRDSDEPPIAAAFTPKGEDFVAGYPSGEVLLWHVDGTKYSHIGESKHESSTAPSSPGRDRPSTPKGAPTSHHSTTSSGSTVGRGRSYCQCNKVCTCVPVVY